RAARAKGEKWYLPEKMIKRRLDVPGRCVYIPALSRRLLRLGYKVMDIKANTANTKKSVQIFEYEEGLDEDLERLAAEEQAKNESGKNKQRVNTLIRSAFLDKKE
ncbi:MAG: hypothetical protein NC299_18365, partial [Lachnospiraceae bacterium]|nr:hypothetical protein [Lachnospiraceae bacterium]